MPEIAPEVAPNTVQYPLFAEADPTSLNADPTRNLGEQIRADAAARGRHDLVGLAWQQDGMTYVVSSHDKIPKERNRVVGRDLLPSWQPRTEAWGPRPSYTQKKPMRDPPSLKRNEHRATEAYSIERYTVDVYNADHELVNIQSHLDKPEFNNDTITRHNPLFTYFDRHDGSKPHVKKPITHFEWLNIAEKPPAERNPHDIAKIDVPLAPGPPGAPKKIFDQVRRHHRALKDRGDGRFEDWVGLTWEQDGLKYQVVRDTLVNHTRTWVVKHYDEHGRPTTRRIYKDNELREHFQSIEADPAKPMSNLHWEVPRTAGRPPRRADQLSWAGWVATYPYTDKTTLANRDFKHSKRLLTGKDVRLDPHIDPASPEFISYQAELETYAKKKPHLVETLAKTINEFGGPRSPSLFTLAASLRDEYMRSVAMLGLPMPGPEKASISGIIWGLVQERYAAEHPTSKAAKRSYSVGTKGRKLDDASVMTHINPFGTTVAAQSRRREMIDYAVAASFIDNALEERITPTEEFHRKGTKVKKVKGFDVHYSLKPEIGIHIQDFIKEDVGKLLSPVLQKGLPPEDMPIEYMTVLGRLLREQYIQ